MDKVSRVPRTHKQAAQAYDRLSHWYDLISGSAEDSYKQIGLEYLAVEPGESVLEIGFGTGKSLLTLSQSATAAGQVVGIDLSWGMCLQAKSRIQRQAEAQDVHLIQADAACIPLESGKIEALFMSFTLELFDTPEIPLILQECRRVLSPGGRFCAVSLSLVEPEPAASRLYTQLHGIFPTFLDCRPIPLVELVQSAGFRILKQTDQKMWGLPVAITVAGLG
jgi:ubiquinone/menaquinone biosynthesis C-methylase UbiE